MAISKMLCPFSKKLCFECPQYRGRHYYLCFNTKYRGYLGETKNEKMNSTSLRGVKTFKMPANLTHSPTWLTINKMAERNYTKIL